MGKKGGDRVGFSSAFFDPLCNTQVLAEAQESRVRLMAGDKVRELTSKSSSEYRTLFLWKGWGRGREEIINDHASA